MKKNLRWILASILLCVALLRTVDASAGPPSDSRWMPIAELTDEFDSDKLDTTKWYDHNSAWSGRQPGFFYPKNVSVLDDRLLLTTRAENLPNLPPGYHSFTTAAVKSRTKVLYGYFEIEAKGMKSRATSAFWFYHEEPAIWTEIDVFEMGAGIPGLESTLFMNAHVFRTPDYIGTPENHLAFGKEWKAPYRLADEYHVYGLRWDKNRIEWFVDGKRIRTMKNRYWHQALYMNFDSEIMGDWLGVPDKAELPATFSIEYIRSWKEVERERRGLKETIKTWYCGFRVVLGLPCV